VGILTELEGTLEETGGTLGELPGLELEALEKITPFSQGQQVIAKALGTKAAGEQIKQAGGEAGSKAGKSAGKVVTKTVAESASATEKFALKVLVNSALLIVGIVLMIAGVLLAVRPSTPAGGLL
jgi:hypothetical protein